jgi:hypothetical protein
MGDAILAGISIYTGDIKTAKKHAISAAKTGACIKASTVSAAGSGGILAPLSTAVTFYCFGDAVSVLLTGKSLEEHYFNLGKAIGETFQDAIIPEREGEVPLLSPYEPSYYIDPYGDLETHHYWTDFYLMIACRHVTCPPNIFAPTFHQRDIPVISSG